MLLNRRRQLIVPAAMVAAGSPPATTTFDPSNTGPSLALSGGNLTVTTSASSVHPITRSIASHSSGKFYCEFILDASALGNGFDDAIGIANSSASLSGTPGFDSSLSAVTYNAGGSDLFVNSSSAGTTIAFTSSNTVDMALDAGAQLIWFRVNGGSWNSSGTADPATGVGGVSVAGVTGPYFAIVSLTNDGQSITANFGATAYSFAAPSGFGNW